MAGPVTLVIKGDAEITRKFRRLGTTGRRKAGRKAIERFHDWFANECANAWKAITIAGGMFRGVFWPPMKPQYTRKDGTVVPPEGGTPRVDGKGSVKPKRSPSGQPITQTSVLVQDTGNLRNDFLLMPKAKDDKRLLLEPSPGTLKYAEEQHKRRPWAFFISSDDRMFQRIAETAYNEQLREDGLI